MSISNLNDAIKKWGNELTNLFCTPGHDYRSGAGIVLPHDQSSFQKAIELPIAGRSYESAVNLDAKELAYLEDIVQKTFGTEHVPIGRTAEGFLTGGAFTGPAGEKVTETAKSSWTNVIIPLDIPV